MTSLKRAIHHPILHSTVLLGLAILSQLRKTPIFVRIGKDGGLFAYFGARILQGDIPYVDIWDHKPPIVFYLNALVEALFKPVPWAVWWLGFTRFMVGHFLIARKWQPSCRYWY